MTTVSGRSAGAQGRQGLRGVVRAGWVAQGVVYAALAWLVVQLALGGAPQQADPQGALRVVAGSGAGGTALLVLGVGLLAHAAGRVLEVTVLATPQVETSDKVKAVALAVLYASLAVSAFSLVGLAATSSGGGSGQREQQGTAFLLGLPGGRLLVGAIGLAVAAYGIRTGVKGVRREFLRTLRTAELPAGTQRAVSRSGTAAHLAKGAVAVLLGWFLVQAAVQYDPSQANGLDGALRAVADAPWGTPLLLAIAVGLLAYAVFCLVEARYRRIGSSASTT